MMTRVWKFNLAITDVQDVAVPSEHKVLCVKAQYNDPVLYVMVNPRDELAVLITILTAGTGHERDDIEDAEYIGTILLNDGNTVYHYFQVVPTIKPGVGETAA